MLSLTSRQSGSWGITASLDLRSVRPCVLRGLRSRESDGQLLSCKLTWRQDRQWWCGRPLPTIPTSSSILGSSRYSRISFRKTDGPTNCATMEKAMSRSERMNLTLVNLQTTLAREGDSPPPLSRSSSQHRPPHSAPTRLTTWGQSEWGQSECPTVTPWNISTLS